MWSLVQAVLRHFLFCSAFPLNGGAQGLSAFPWVVRRGVPVAQPGVAPLTWGVPSLVRYTIGPITTTTSRPRLFYLYWSHYGPHSSLRSLLVPIVFGECQAKSDAPLPL